MMKQMADDVSAMQASTAGSTAVRGHGSFAAICWRILLRYQSARKL